MIGSDRGAFATVARRLVARRLVVRRLVPKLRLGTVRAAVLLAGLAGPCGCQSARSLVGVGVDLPARQTAVSSQEPRKKETVDLPTPARPLPDGVARVKIGAPIVRTSAYASAPADKPGRSQTEFGNEKKDTGDTTHFPTSTPVVPPAPECRLDLSRALLLAGVENPTIGRAFEVVRASEAELLGARALLLPTLNGGFTIDLHDGNLQGAAGVIRDVRRGSLYVGAGAGVRAAETVPIPGIRIFAHIADAIYEPRAARERVTGRRFDADATRNNILLEVAVRYLALAGAEARLQTLRQTEADLAKVVKLAADLANVGQWRQGDADRSASESLLLHTEEQEAEGEVVVASAELTRLLSLDPSTRLRVAEDTVPVVQLVDPALTLEQLLQIARSSRPEVGAREADIARAETRLREERVRPLVPLLSIGYSAGDFGGGSNLTRPHWGNYGGRTDFDVFAVWSLQNLGLGNLALQRERRAEVGQAEAQLFAEINRINREVTDAFALSAARRRDVGVARRRVSESLAGFTSDLLRARNLAGKPIEVLNSLNLLTAARQDLVRALTEYSQAQVRLFVSLGQPPAAEISGQWPVVSGQ